MADGDPIPREATTKTTTKNSNARTIATGLDLDDPRFEQRYVMALFYFATDGDNWERNAGWLGPRSECEWQGVAGDSDGCPGGCVRGRDDDLGGEYYDRVCRMGMGRGNNLYGELPSELGILEEMRWFEIQQSYVIGTIPESIGRKWTKLHTLLLGYNNMHGGFPDAFANSEMLGTVFVDHNGFNGTFPSVFGTLKNLEWLDAENNGFEGGLPASIGDLKSLRIFNVNGNNMTGPLPDTWDEDNLIEDFEVAGNDFDGPLPPSLGRAAFLKDLRASRNRITGTIPAEYHGLERLEELYLDENDMFGELPPGAEPLYDGLQEFSVHSNGFSGRFPVEHFEDTFRLKVLSLHNNQLTGVITENICARVDPSLSYTRLIELTVDCNLIECECCTCYDSGLLDSTYSPPIPTPDSVTSTATNSPTSFGNGLTNQEQYVGRPTRAPNSPMPDRNGSAIRDQIQSDVLQRSASFDDMNESDPRHLAVEWILQIDRRRLTADDVNLYQRYVLALLAFSLDSLAWYACGEHRTFGNRTELYASEDCELQNSATGRFEGHKVWLSGAEECEWYGVICSSDGFVRGLELIGNDLIGQIPPEISQLRSIQYLALNGNCLYGTIPPEFGTMPNLLSLELHGNGLSGELPVELYNMSTLQLLNVAMQYQFANVCYMSDGTVVNTLFQQGGATDVSYNLGLMGNVLDSNAANWVDMKGLHLFDNSFTGSIAEEIGELKDLVFLRAQNNMVSSYLPDRLGDLKKLREVYLFKNEIYFDIPISIGGMGDLEDLRLHENEMSGPIPDSFYNLIKLKKVWLQDTIFCEEVWGGSLECAATSDYGFTGTISTQIGNLNKLEQLLISNNPFEGTVPTEIGLCDDLALLHMHKTNIVGSAPLELCSLRDKSLNNEVNQGVFYADCSPNNKTQDPFFFCDCCSDCCDHTTKVCIADD